VKATHPVPDDPQSARRRALRAAQHLEGASSPTNRHRARRSTEAEVYVVRRAGRRFAAGPDQLRGRDAPPELDAGMASEIEAGAP